MKPFEYTKENLRKLQLVELEMLKEVDRLCRSHNINYVIDGGTLLGAVRYGGFIPWDDDIDIRMLRKDYDKFCSLCADFLDKKYFLQTHKTDPGYRWGYARILKNGSVFIRKDHEELTSKTGIFIDIFPQDNLPERGFGYQFCTCLSWICRKILYSELGRYHAHSISKRIGFSILNILPKSWAHRSLAYLTEKYHNITSSKVRCFGWGSKEETIGFLRDWFEDTCDISFEGLLVKAPVKTHEYLIHSFGIDYMLPPPESERKPIHIASYIKF